MSTARRLRLDDAPWDMAFASLRVVQARSYVEKQIKNMHDGQLADCVYRMVFEESRRPARLATVNSLTGRGEPWASKLGATLAYDPTWAAPGASFGSHHGYPGGWMLHTALNMKSIVHMAEQVRTIKHVEVDQDALVAAMALHDWAKLKLLTWNEDHTLDADEGPGHHPLVIAECMLRNIPPRVVHLLAGIHNGWWRNPEAVEKDVRRAARWIDIHLDRSEYAVPAGRHTVEAWIVRQGEINWYGATRETVQRIRDVLTAWSRRRSVPHSVERLQNAFFTTYDELYVNQLLALHDTRHVFSMLDEWFRRVT